uniref:Ig-like domain-containing protein n=1 Tax=Chelydra serpentina TaxID=8475 RepID=A0A8C3SL24_CHESE
MLSAAPTSSVSAYVEQPPFLTVYSGNSPTLQCTLKQSNCDKIYWYRQQGSRELEGLFCSYEDHLVNFTAEPRAILRRNKKCDLNLKNLSKSDSALYYCACSTA